VGKQRSARERKVLHDIGPTELIIVDITKNVSITEVSTGPILLALLTVG
jgi:hypothetical protein